jgi:hypothetical protein
MREESPPLSPGNANLLNGVLQIANREIGVPGLDLHSFPE